MAGVGEIQVLRLRDGVRMRPGMYFGNVNDDSGLHHWMTTLIELATDDARAGLCHQLHVTLRRDGSVAIRFDGPGRALGTQRSLAAQAEPFGATGLWVAGAASEWLRCEVVRAGSKHVVASRSGEISEPATTEPSDEPEHVVIDAAPDPRVFGPMVLSRVYLTQWLRERAHLIAGFATVLVDEREDPPRRVAARGDLRAWVAELVGERGRAHPEPIIVSRKSDEAAFELALQWVDDVGLDLRSAVNDHPTSAGGCHVDALLRALGPATDGLVAVLNVNLANPRYGNGTKDRLVGPVGPLDEWIGEAVHDMFESRPDFRPAIVARRRSIVPPLEASLARSPGDASTALVYADALLEADDPRGEVVAIMCALHAETHAVRRETLDRRAATLLADEHARIWNRPGGFPFHAKWHGRSYFWLVHRGEITALQEHVRQFLDKWTDSLGPAEVSAPAHHRDVLAGLGFEPIPSPAIRGPTWGRNSGPAHSIHDAMSVLGRTGVQLEYRFRLARERVWLPYQRAGWYAHGRSLASHLHTNLETGAFYLDLQLPFDDLDDATFVQLRRSLVEVFGVELARIEAYQRFVPGPYGDGMSPYSDDTRPP